MNQENFLKAEQMKLGLSQMADESDQKTNQIVSKYTVNIMITSRSCMTYTKQQKISCYQKSRK